MSKLIPPVHGPSGTRAEVCRKLGHSFVTGPGPDGKLHAVCDFCGTDRAEALAEYRRRKGYRKRI